MRVKRHPAKTFSSTLNEIAEEAKENAKCTRRKAIQAAAQTDRCRSVVPRWLRFDIAGSGLDSSDGCGHERQSHSLDSVPGAVGTALSCRVRWSARRG